MIYLLSNQIVILDGQVLTNCFAADVAKGIAKCFEIDAEGKVVMEGFRAKVKIVQGKIEIKSHEEMAKLKDMFMDQSLGVPYPATPSAIGDKPVTKRVKS
jgi:hypothetical protein